jgi:multicomponent Na+:H+ antiporter subunit D
MPGELPPGWVLIAGAAAVPLLPGLVRAAYLLALTALSAWLLHTTPDHVAGGFGFLGFTLTPVHLDPLARLFAWSFHAAFALAVLYALRLRDAVQHVAAAVYAGAAIAAVCAGDLITLFVFWELTASSVFLVWAARTESALRAGLRYLLWQVGSGVALLIGASLLISAGHERLDPVAMGSVGATVLLIAFGIKAAFPLLHVWVTDAYPRATPAGAVFLSIFSTKLALYALARFYAGTEVLVPIGIAGAVGATVYAAAQDDLRRLLAYVLVAQLGVSVAGIGLGGGAWHGALRHAVAGQFYFALMFMATGAVLARTGTARLSELRGAGRGMPLTLAAAAVGGLTAAGVPFLAGYPGKTLILDEAALLGTWSWLGLMFSAAGAAYLCALRLPWALCGSSGEHAPAQADAPWDQALAMALTALACLGLGVARNLPGVHAPLDLGHAASQGWLLAGVALAFVAALAVRAERRDAYATPPDADWALRQALPETFYAARTVWTDATRTTGAVLWPGAVAAVRFAHQRYFGPHGLWGRTWPTGRIMLYTAGLLGAYLLLSFL